MVREAKEVQAWLYQVTHQQDQWMQAGMHQVDVIGVGSFPVGNPVLGLSLFFYWVFSVFLPSSTYCISNNRAHVTSALEVTEILQSTNWG